MTYRIAIGTVGSGLWVSYNSGGKFRHIPRGIDAESNCRALAVSPHDPGQILAAVDRVGVFRSDDNGGEWAAIGTPITTDIWSLGFDPNDRDRLYVGTRPGIQRSTDGGASFHELDTSIPDRCPIGVPRTTNVVVDPRDSARVWASVEVAGVHRSVDGGDTWTALGPIGPSAFHDDIHGFTLRRTGADTMQLLATSPFGLARSDDDGETWAWHEFDPFLGAKSEYAYSRCVRAPWDDGTVIVCVGDYIPGAVGALEVSRDGGETWKRADLPAPTNSTMYWLAVHDDVPGVVVATTVFGQVFVSEDHASTWRKLDREFGEIRAVCVTPG
jgi:photosystem II stability/assembly factor-like uncharacterized protein